MNVKLKITLITATVAAMMPVCAFAQNPKSHYTDINGCNLERQVLAPEAESEAEDEEMESTPNQSPTMKVESINVTSSGFSSGTEIPIQYVCTKITGGKNLSIPLQWSKGPEGTKSYAVFMYDLNPMAKNFVHWAVVNISKDAEGLKEGASGSANLPKGTLELENTSAKIGYMGPCPPTTSGRHEYKIIVYALNTERLNLSNPVTLLGFNTAVDGKVLAKGELSGYFTSK